MTNVWYGRLKRALQLMVRGSLSKLRITYIMLVGILSMHKNRERKKTLKCMRCFIHFSQVTYMNLLGT